MSGWNTIIGNDPPEKPTESHDRMLDRPDFDQLEVHDLSRPERAVSEEVEYRPFSRAAERNRCSIRERSTSKTQGTEGFLFADDLAVTPSNLDQLPYRETIEKPGQPPGETLAGSPFSDPTGSILAKPAGERSSPKTELPDEILGTERLGPWQERDILNTMQDMNDWVQENRGLMKLLFKKGGGQLCDEELDRMEQLMIEKDEHRRYLERNWPYTEQQKLRNERLIMQRRRGTIRNDQRARELRRTGRTGHSK